MAHALKVYPQLSPRIIEVLDPTTDITVQEIVDAIRAWEDSVEGQYYPYLIDAAGKEQLGGGVTVGITATLKNARLMFTGRTTPLDDGVGRTCDLTDADGTHLYVDDADFISAGIYPGCTVHNETTGDMGAVTEVTDANNLQMFRLTGTGSGSWTSGDSYIIYENVQCNITGGNLVAVDDVGAELPSVFQSPNVQVVRSSSSSATLQELTAIQHSSFNGGVTIDVANLTGKAVSGTTFPTGTPEQPVDNLTDLHTISLLHGLNKVYIIGDLTIDDTAVWERHEFIGESILRSTVTVLTAAQVEYCEFCECTLTGILDDSCKVEKASLLNVTIPGGYVFNCTLSAGTVILGAGATTHILDAHSAVPGTTTPIIDLNGTGILSLRDYSGGLKLINYSGAGSHSLDMTSGQVILDSGTITSGTFVVRGVGKLIDENGVPIPTGVWNGGVTILNELITAPQEEIDPQLNLNLIKAEFNRRYRIAGLNYKIKVNDGLLDILKLELGLSLSDPLTVLYILGYNIDIVIDNNLTGTNFIIYGSA